MQMIRRLTALVAVSMTLLALPVHAAVSSAESNGLSGMISSLLPTVVSITSRIGQTVPTPTASANSTSSLAAATNNQLKLLTGSGFIIDESGYIVTNYHVVANAYEIMVAFSDGQHAEAKLIGAVRVCDIALLKVEVNRKLPAALWGDSDKLLAGDQVFAVGNPLGVGLSVSSGVVSAVNRDIMDTPYDDFIQTDAAINHGNSGGPLFNSNGEVIGVDTAIISPTTGSVGLGFAIPANDASVLVARLMRYGWARPGWLGFRVEAVTPEIANAIGTPSPAGSIVSEVTPNSPAAQAGLQVGDIITRIGDHVPTDERALMRQIANSPIGITLSLTVRRGGQELALPATIAEWPRQDWDARNAPIAVVGAAPPVPADLGLDLTDLTEAARAQYGLPSALNGVKVGSVTAGTDAAERGLAAGDIILSVQNTPAISVQQVRLQIDQARTQHRDFVLLLVISEASGSPAPKFVALRLASD